MKWMERLHEVKLEVELWSRQLTKQAKATR